MLSRSLSLIVFVAGLCAVPPFVSAQSAPEPEQLRRDFDQATALYERGAYAQAEIEFRRVIDQLPEGDPRRAVILVNVARSVEAQPGREREALRLYEEMIDATDATTGNPAVAEGRRIAQERITELRLRLAAREDGEREPHSNAPSGAAPSPVGPIVLGGGGALLVASAITGGLALSQRGDVLARCDGTRCPPDASAQAASISDLALATDVLWVSGAVIAAVGLVLTFVLHDDAASSEAQLSASCGPTGCMAALEGSFE